MNITVSGQYHFTDWKQGIQFYLHGIWSGDPIVCHDKTISFDGIVLDRDFGYETFYVYGETSIPAKCPTFDLVPIGRIIRCMADMPSTVEAGLIRFATNDAVWGLFVTFPKRTDHPLLPLSRLGLFKSQDSLIVTYKNIPTKKGYDRAWNPYPDVRVSS